MFFVQLEAYLNKSLLCSDKISDNQLQKIPTLLLSSKLYLAKKNKLFAEGILSKVISIYEQNYQPSFKSNLLEVYNLYIDLLKPLNRVQEIHLIENKIDNLK